MLMAHISAILTDAFPAGELAVLGVGLTQVAAIAGVVHRALLGRNTRPAQLAYYNLFPGLVSRSASRPTVCPTMKARELGAGPSALTTGGGNLPSPPADAGAWSASPTDPSLRRHTMAETSRWCSDLICRRLSTLCASLLRDRAPGRLSRVPSLADSGSARSRGQPASPAVPPRVGGGLMFIRSSGCRASTCPIHGYSFEAAPAVGRSPRCGPAADLRFLKTSPAPAIRLGFGRFCAPAVRATGGWWCRASSLLLELLPGQLRVLQSRWVLLEPMNGNRMGLFASPKPGRDRNIHAPASAAGSRGA